MDNSNNSKGYFVSATIGDVNVKKKPASTE